MAEEKQHWDVVGLTIDMHPPFSIPSPPSFTRNTAYMGLEQASESLGILWNLDLTFMRPKIIFVRLYGLTARDVRYVPYVFCV